MRPIPIFCRLLAVVTLGAGLATSPSLGSARPDRQAPTVSLTVVALACTDDPTPLLRSAGLPLDEHADGSVSVVPVPGCHASDGVTFAAATADGAPWGGCTAAAGLCAFAVPVDAALTVTEVDPPAGFEPRQNPLAVDTSETTAAFVLAIDLAIEGEADGGPAGVVTAYYQPIAAYDYARAYGELGAAFHRRQTQEEFTAGFADTAYVAVHVIGTAERGAGTTEVAVKVVAWHNDGTVHQYHGSYTVGEEGGAAKLVDATIVEDPAPATMPHLCRPVDLRATATNDAGAGNRFATIKLTNASNAVCVLGGYPHIELSDGTGRLLIGSEHEANLPIVTVPLPPGGTGTVALRWTNWCGDPIGADLTAAVTLPGDSADRVTLADSIGVPPCLGPDLPSHLTVRPFATGSA
jgi:hypothetical protein